KRLLMALAVVAALGWVGNSAYASDFDKSHGASVQLVRGGHGHGHSGWYGGRGHGHWHGGHGSYYHSYPRYYHSYPRYNYYYSYPSYRSYYPSYRSYYPSYRSYYPSYGYGSHGSFYYGSPRVGISFGW